MADVVVIGAGVAGLGVALCTGRSGHRVTLVERDDTPLPVDAHGAFEWDRRGAPQVRHSHAFLARLHNLLRDRHPEVLDQLVAAGATPMDFIAMLPEGMDRTPMPGDEDLVALACRRTTYEWVLRRIVTEGPTPLAALRHGHGVASLLADRYGPGDVPVVRGVQLDDGAVVAADVVVDASGRRSPLPRWLGDLGIDLAEEVEDTGIVYYSRFFALRDGAGYPEQVGPIGGDLDYLKYGVFRGDDRTFSITLAVRVDDERLRRGLLDPDRFLRVAAAVPATAAHVDERRATPITGVHVMTSLLNRRRWFATDDDPVVLGLHAVGDAHTCTNPLYGRGCSLAMVQAQLLADSLQEHGTDHTARALAYEAASRREITPWYKAAVAQDRMGRRATGPATDAPSTEGMDQRELARAIMRDGLLPAIRVDPVVLRAFLRMFNLLEPPDSLMTDADVVGRVMGVYQSRDQRPPEPPAGPPRDEVLALIS